MYTHKNPCPPTCPNPRVCLAHRLQHKRLSALTPDERELKRARDLKPATPAPKPSAHRARKGWNREVAALARAHGVEKAVLGAWDEVRACFAAGYSPLTTVNHVAYGL